MTEGDVVRLLLTKAAAARKHDSPNAQEWADVLEYSAQILHRLRMEEALCLPHS